MSVGWAWGSATQVQGRSYTSNQCRGESTSFLSDLSPALLYLWLFCSSLYLPEPQSPCQGNRADNVQ